MTISFDYRMDAYTQTDSGANMVIVPAGLGALGAGVIDVEFIKEADAEGVQLLGKGRISVEHVTAVCGMSESTFYRRLREYRGKRNDTK